MPALFFLELGIAAMKILPHVIPAKAGTT